MSIALIIKYKILNIKYTDMLLNEDFNIFSLGLFFDQLLFVSCYMQRELLLLSRILKYDDL